VNGCHKERSRVERPRAWRYGPRMDLRSYAATEVAEHAAEGNLTRREAIRRLALLGITGSSAAALLAACSSSATTAATTATSTAVTTSTPAAAPTTSSATTAPTSALVATSAATTTASTAPNTTTAPAATGAALEVSQITFPGPAGELKGAFSAAPKPKGAVLIVHEIFGLSAHFLKLPGRFAASGYTALVVDLLSREGGSAGIADQGQIAAKIVGGGVERHLTDLRAGLDELGKRAPGVKLGMVGFCFGGGMTWSMLNAGEPRLAVAAPFYGPGVDGADFSKSKAAVLGVYAENDARVNASRDAMEAALTKARLVHEIKTFPGVGHQFFNDTGSAYNPTQAEAAYTDLMSWFAAHLD
jgi:carboxymethylenebutenolidase